MISLETARKLKQAGLTWQPQQGDLFLVPDRGMDSQVFVINDMATMIESLRGAPAVTFHGTPEWALDYVSMGETVWLPSEEQLRTELERRLTDAGVTVYDMLSLDGTYACRYEWHGEAVVQHAASAPEAYAAALLEMIRSEAAE